MSFTYSVIGSNTPENREHLEKIGYVRGFFNIQNRGYIKTINPGTYNLTNIIQPLTEYINCIGNPALFRAVTAMRDDSDYMQWFTDGEKWILCFGDSFGKWYYSLGKYLSFSLDTIHKATLSELQEHFK